ncbi:type II toxin-antitoxin system RelE/ParE family toxin [Rubrobacter marinus]|uniref:Type II toxin-antitoxin system RelE/ParE family toxin n=1 Tax=Rubrobacter marinus TaxID=2653852 RepID=A0A6G8Q1J0_9ACTN|nr:type II toxin-antitoxin system RelE/ParE family toxin [Rubrobacter marinus]
MSYSLFIEVRTDKELGKLPQDAQDRIDEAIDDLADDPKPPASRKLQGREGYRLRVGDYRVLYAVDDTEMRVIVTRVGHRKNVYR